MTDPVKQKIHELCPDVLELKFGCEVLWKMADETAFLTGLTYTVGDSFGSIPAKKFWVTHKPIKGVDSFSEGSKEWQVLGSPLTLAVVLRAMEKSNDGFALKLHTIHDSFFFQENTPAWNLEHDTYDQQSEETKAFIGSLLGV